MYLGKFKARFIELSTIYLKKITPCTKEEVSDLEEQLLLSLPLVVHVINSDGLQDPRLLGEVGDLTTRSFSKLMT